MFRILLRSAIRTSKFVKCSKPVRFVMCIDMTPNSVIFVMFSGVMGIPSEHRSLLLQLFVNLSLASNVILEDTRC